MKLIDILVMISKGELKEGTKIILRDELYTLKKKELTKGYGIKPTIFENYNLGALNEEVQLIQPNHIGESDKKVEKIEVLDIDSTTWNDLYIEQKLDILFEKQNEVIRRINNERL